MTKTETKGMSYDTPNRRFSSGRELGENYDVHSHVDSDYEILSFLFERDSCCSKQMSMIWRTSLLMIYVPSLERL